MMSGYAVCKGFSKISRMLPEPNCPSRRMGAITKIWLGILNPVAMLKIRLERITSFTKIVYHSKKPPARTAHKRTRERCSHVGNGLAMVLQGLPFCHITAVAVSKDVHRATILHLAALLDSLIL